MPDRDDVCVLIPTLNEAGTIGDVVDDFREAGFEHVLVIDGDSGDGTREVARDHGARVVEQTGAGKGQAVREAIDHVDRDVVLMADGDGTYRAEDADAMLEPIFEGTAEHVIGDRFADMEPGAMSRLNRVGNRLINRVFASVHGRDLRDILSGYRAFTKQSIRRFDLTSEGFGIETELAAECVKHQIPTTVVPITYRARPDASDTNLRPFRDGSIIFLTLYRLAKTNNPLFYFGSVGLASSFVGLALGGYVGYEWFVRSVSHEVIAVVATFAILFGVQLLMFGVLSDLIVAVNREQTRRTEELLERLKETDEAGATVETEAEPEAGTGTEE